MKLVRNPLALVLSALLAVGCDQDSVSFGVVGLDAPPSGIAPNDAIAVRFSVAMASVLPDGAIRVFDGTTRLGTRAVVENDVIRLFASTPEGWPSGHTLSVEVPVPTLSRPLHAKDGSSLTRAFRATIAIRDDWSPRSGALSVSSADVPVRDVTAGTVLRVTFDTPLDPTSIEGGLEIRDAAGRIMPGVRVTLTGSRTVTISPFVYITPAPTEAFTLAATTKLMALDGRRLQRPVVWRFVCTDAELSGEFATSFEPSEVLEGTRADNKSGLRPIRVGAVHAVPRGLDDPESRRPVPFGATPSRVQALLPLPAAPMLVESLTLRLAAPWPSEIHIPALSVRIEMAKESYLAVDADRNARAPRSVTPRDITLRPDSDGIVTIPLESPVSLDPADSPDSAPAVLVDISNESGTDGATATLAGTLAFHGADIGRWLESVPGTPSGDLGAFAPRLVLTGHTHAPVLLRPFTAPVRSPVWIERPGSVTGIGRAGTDWRVEWRFFGDPLANETPGPWESSLSALAGHQSIQGRIIFPVSSAAPENGEAIIERLAVPWKAGPEEARD